MPQYKLVGGLNGWESLDLRVSASMVAVTGLTVGAVTKVAVTCADDPLPEPEPPPSYPGDEPPIDYPVLPPSGPAGPG